MLCVAVSAIFNNSNNQTVLTMLENAIKFCRKDEIYDWAQLKDCYVVMPKMPGWFMKLVKKKEHNENANKNLSKLKETSKRNGIGSSNKDPITVKSNEENLYKGANLKKCSVVAPKMPDWAINSIKNKNPAQSQSSNIKVNNCEKENLKLYEMREKSKKETLSCQYCDKSFTKSQILMQHEKLRHRGDFCENTDKNEIFTTKNIQQESENVSTSNEAQSQINNDISDINDTFKFVDTGVTLKNKVDQSQTRNQNDKNENASVLAIENTKQESFLNGVLSITNDDALDIKHYFDFIDRNENPKSGTDLIQTNCQNQSMIPEINHTMLQDSVSASTLEDLCLTDMQNLSEIKLENQAIIYGIPTENKEKAEKIGTGAFLDSSETISKPNDSNLHNHDSYKLVDINQILKKTTTKNAMGCISKSNL